MIKTLIPPGYKRGEAGGQSDGSGTLFIEGAALSHVGQVRSTNEDTCIADAKATVFLVADGMGGHAAGEVASHLAAKTVVDALAVRDAALDPGKQLVTAVCQANERVYEEQQRIPACRGMGSTLTVLLFSRDLYYLAQIGDSRAYLLRDGKLCQLSRDHSVVWPMFERGELSKEEIARHPRRHVITRCIGHHPQVEIDLTSDSVKENDIYLLCSDGLTDVLSDNEIQRVLTACGQHPKKACKTLVYAANNCGGPDNITAVVVSLTAKKPPLHHVLPMTLTVSSR